MVAHVALAREPRVMTKPDWVSSARVAHVPNGSHGFTTASPKSERFAQIANTRSAGKNAVNASKSAMSPV
jgi:hypothetical protein